METPKEIYISVERTYEATNGEVIGMVTTHTEKQSETDVKYVRADAAELTWGDVQMIDHYILQLVGEERDGKTDWGDGEKFYKEVLRRFNENSIKG